MTKEEFEQNYAKGSDMSVQELRASGLIAVECHCNYEHCKGWAMIFNDPVQIAIHNDLYGKK